jgi:hypothetical protein
VSPPGPLSGPLSLAAFAASGAEEGCSGGWGVCSYGGGRDDGYGGGAEPSMPRPMLRAHTPDRHVQSRRGEVAHRGTQQPRVQGGGYRGNEGRQYTQYSAADVRAPPPVTPQQQQLQSRYDDQQQPHPKAARFLAAGTTRGAAAFGLDVPLDRLDANRGDASTKRPRSPVHDGSSRAHGRERGYVRTSPPAARERGGGSAGGAMNRAEAPVRESAAAKRPRSPVQQRGYGGGAARRDEAPAVVTEAPSTEAPSEHW